MKPAALYIAVPALALLAGWASVTLGGGHSRRGEPSGGTTTTSHPRPRERGPSTAPWQAQDFLQLLTRQSIVGGLQDPLTAAMAGWTDAEILAALHESMADASLFIGGDGTTPTIPGLLLREYIRRDFDSALAWFGSIPDAQKAVLSPYLLSNWPAARAEEGLAYIRQNPTLAAGLSRNIINLNLTAAATRGVGELTALMRTLQAEGYDVRFTSGFSPLSGKLETVHFPPGFDFPTLLTSAEAGYSDGRLSFSSRPVFGQWLAQDREAAYHWLLENHGPGSLDLIDLISRDRPPGIDQWFTGKLEAMDPAHRAEFISSEAGNWRDPSTAEPLLAATRGSPIHQEILSAATQGFFSGNYIDTADMVAYLPEPEQRFRFLETLVNTTDKGAASEPSGNTPAVDETEETIFLGRLRSWGADEARATAILRRLKGEAGK